MNRYDRRRNTLVEQLPARVGAAVVVPGPTFRYLTGIEMPATERPVLLVLTPTEQPAMITPPVYANRFQERLGETVEHRIYAEDRDPITAAGEELMATFGAHQVEGAVAVSFRATRLYDFATMADPYGWDEVQDLDPIADELRSVKDDDECETMRAAARMADEVLGQVMARVEPGMTETAVDRVLRTAIVEIGAEAESLRSVSSGERTADPIGQPTERELQAGELLMVDVGLVHDGYEADLTRTVAIGGEPAAELREMHAVVRRAARAARAVVSPDTPAAAVDRAAREVIEDAGFGDAFPHRVGHGLGLEPHEAPFLGAENETPLRPGNVCTVEPGIYVDGLGGVRIEDELLVTEGGAEILTATPRGLQFEA